MRTVSLPFPELIAIAATRGMLGAGIGLLVADQLTHQQRRTIGWTLLALGALSTIPLAYDVLVRRRQASPLECEIDIDYELPAMSHA